MKAKFDLVLYSSLTLASLALSFYVSQPKADKKTESDIAWFDLGKNSVSELSFSRGATKVLITKKDDAPGHRILIEVSSEKTEDSEAQSLPVSEKFNQLVEGLRPLYAERKLGLAKDLELKEFGLEEDPGILAIKYGTEGVLNLRIGKKAYGGSSRFVLDESRGEILLVDSKMFYFLENAQVELVEKAFFAEDENLSKVEFDYAEGVVKAAFPFGKKGAGDWSTTVDASKKDEKLSNFISRLLKLRVDRYATVVESSKLASGKAVISLRTFDETKKKDDLKIYKVSDESTKEQSYFVHSSLLDAFARIQTNVGEKIEKDFSEIFQN